MYSEMLAEGMVKEPAQQRHYLQTLCAEANRLGHLVENVLAFARLERGRAQHRLEHLPLKSLLDRIQPRLEQRTLQAGLQFQIAAPQETLRAELNVDVGAVEQILFNLVDNACKYAGPTTTTSPSIQLNVTSHNGTLNLEICDHGPGISPADARRLFRPFSKSAQQAAHSAPGVGLGLALCRRLSRSLGGDLTLDVSHAGGACFRLSLPVSPS